MIHEVLFRTQMTDSASEKSERGLRFLIQLRWLFGVVCVSQSCAALSGRVSMVPGG